MYGIGIVDIKYNIHRCKPIATNLGAAVCAVCVMYGRTYPGCA